MFEILGVKNNENLCPPMFGLPLVNGKTQVPPSTVEQEWRGNGSSEQTRLAEATRAVKRVLGMSRLMGRGGRWTSLDASFARCFAIF